MKLLILSLTLLAGSIQAQTVTALQLRTVIVISGTSITNTVNVPTNAIPAIQLSIQKWNVERAAATPPQPAITNAAQFCIEAAKARVQQATNDFDLDIPKTLAERIAVMSEADKQTIRNILLSY